MNQFIECIDCGAEETLFGILRDLDEPVNLRSSGILDALEYIWRKCADLERMLNVFQRSLGSAVTDELHREFKANVQVTAAVAERDVAALKALRSDNLSLAEMYKDDCLWHNGNRYDNLLVFAFKMDCGQEMAQYLLSDGYLLPYLEPGRGSKNRMGFMLSSAVEAALQAGYGDAVKELLRHVKSISTVSCAGKLALYAARTGETEIIRRCLYESPDSVLYTDEGWSSTLHLAALYGYSDIVKLLYKIVPHVGNIRDETPAYWAIVNGHIDIVELFLSGGFLKSHVDNNWKSNTADWDWTHLACAHGRKEIYELLIKYEFNPKMKDRWGFVPLDYLKEK